LYLISQTFDPALRGRLEEIFLMFRELAEAETAVVFLDALADLENSR
jgi:hypothetical protein